MPDEQPARRNIWEILQFVVLLASAFLSLPTVFGTAAAFIIHPGFEAGSDNIFPIVVNLGAPLLAVAGGIAAASAYFITKQARYALGPAVVQALLSCILLAGDWEDVSDRAGLAVLAGMLGLLSSAVIGGLALAVEAARAVGRRQSQVAR